MGMDIYGKNDPTYFRASLWSWRPLRAISAMAIDKYELGLSTDSWGYNDGHGLDNQEECDKLAAGIMRMITESEELFKLDDDDEPIYLCLGMWCTNEGTFISEQETEDLNDEHPSGTIIKSPIVTSKGTLAYPSHSTSLSKIREWVAFLRECGGFQIF
jgi:hypothetical protein